MENEEEYEGEEIFKIFEEELGRTLSQTELALINGWLISGTKEELVIGALKESDLSEQELAAICTMHNKDETTELGIRYEELIALCVKEIQRLNKRVEELEDKK